MPVDRRTHRTSTSTARRTGVGLASVGLVLALVGCGSEEAPRDSSPPATSGDAGSPTTSTPAGGDSPADTDLFPVSVTRTGGFAGADDAIVVAADGTVTLKTRRGSSTCTLEDDALDDWRDVSTGLARSDPSAAPNTPDVVDGYVITVSSPQGTSPLPGPAFTANSDVVEALLRVADGPPASGACG